MRSAPFSPELGKIDHELGLSQTSAVRERARGVRDALKLGLRGDVVLDVDLQVWVVLLNKGVDHELEDEGSISCPSKPVIRQRYANVEKTGLPGPEMLIWRFGS